jgi:uncharacterized RDD family membrane protein YckC
MSIDSKDFSGYSLKELYDLYVKTDKDLNPTEHKLIYEEISEKERGGLDINRSGNLASLSDRFLARVIDNLISNTPAILILIILFGINNLFDILRGKDYSKTLVLMFLFNLIFAIINWKLLYKNGQTIGKKYLGIKIVTKNNTLPLVTKSYFIRYLVPAFIEAIPLIGGLFSIADILFIFTDERRCVHDRIAGTKVVTCGENGLNVNEQVDAIQPGL